MNKRTLFIILFAAIFSQSTVFGQLTQQLQKAQDNNQAVFLVVTDDGDAKFDKAMQMAGEAQAKVGNAQVLELNRSDASNSELVKQYGVNTAPVPLFLVFAENGMLAGGQLYSQTSSDKLAAAIPSPKKQQVMETLKKGKSAFLVVSSASMEKKSDIVNTCQQACIEMEQNARIIQIDLDDPKEKAFLASLKINTNISEPQTFVINSKGQVTGKFSGDVNADNLVATAKRVVKTGGCCPGGSSKGCK